MIAVKGNENKVIFHMNVQNQAMVYHTVMIGDLLYYTIRPKFFYPDTMVEWCRIAFGEPVIILGDYKDPQGWYEFTSTFYFANEEHRTAFAIRWI